MFLHIAPRKVRIVASLLRGMDVKRAELELHHLPKRASAPLAKLLKSAVQNAVNLQKDKDMLFIKKINVDAGPVIKRMMPRAFGRAATIHKRMSHVSLVLGVWGEADTAVAHKTQKAKQAEVRVADWEEVKGDLAGDRVKHGIMSEKKTTQKKFGGFGKKIFTRKVI